MMMKRTLSIILVIAGFLLSGNAQTFTNINAGLFGVGFGSAAWGDYDNDGDLDLAILGEPPSTIPVTKIYRNDNGSFTDISASLAGYTYSSTEWGDYDNDSDLDLLVTGFDSLTVSAAKIFGNFNGLFVDVGAILPAVAQGNATWGDFDNDNDLDILIAGNQRSKILRNDGKNVFTDIGAGLPNIQNAFGSWADYDNDGWLDVLVGGDENGTYVTKLFRNNHGTFEEAPVSFIGLDSGCAKWGDLDNDGDKDLILAGMDQNIVGTYLIYKNLGGGQFGMIDNYTFNVLNPTADLGDYDNDGLLDIILTGRIQGCGGTAVTMLYHNDGNFVFSDINTGIQGFRQGASLWGDFNNDGFTDLLFNGFTQTSDPMTEIYMNDFGSGTFTANTPPVPPSNLASLTSGSDVQLTWNRATDAQTPSDGLSYNLWIGTSQDLADVMNPLSNLETGFRKVVKIGNAGKDTTITIHDLSAGTYYWSVQAIDNGFLGSTFAEPQSFVLDPVGLNEFKDNEITFYPNPATEKIIFENPCKRNGSVQVCDVSGNVILSFSSIPDELNISNLPKGIYLLKICDSQNQQVRKLIRE
jgi:hypothetical protein